jgi:predicted amidophosphoribosyltransferase
MNQLSPDPTSAFVSKERYKLCPACGNFVGFVEKDVYCVMCGERLIDACPRCLEPVIYPIAKFCPACGEHLVLPRAPERR